MMRNGQLRHLRHHVTGGPGLPAGPGYDTLVTIPGPVHDIGGT